MRGFIPKEWKKKRRTQESCRDGNYSLVIRKGRLTDGLDMANDHALLCMDTRS